MNDEPGEGKAYQTLFDPLEIDEQAIWATRIEDDKIRVYINETDTLTFTNIAAVALWKSLGNVLAERRSS